MTYGEAFTVQPFGNTLVTMTLTAQQLKDFLEQQFAGCAIPGEPAQTVDRILQVSKGFKFSWSASAAPCDKIESVSLNGADIVAEREPRGGGDHHLSRHREQLHVARR